MKPRYRPPTSNNCAVVVNGNGFLASVQTFDVSTPGCRQISLDALKSRDAVRLEIAPERGGSVTVQLGDVQWVDQGTVAVRIVKMDAEDKRRIDEIAWSSIKGEFRLLRWLRKLFWGQELRYVYLSFEPLSFENSTRLPKAA